MLEIFSVMAVNLGFPLENVLLFVAWLGGLIFAAKDFRLATVYWFVISAGMFLWMFTLAGNGEDIDYYFSLVLMFISLVVMALNLLFIKKNAEVVI